MNEKRSWPNEEHYKILMADDTEGWRILDAYLPAVQTDEQEFFMRRLHEKIATSNG